MKNTQVLVKLINIEKKLDEVVKSVKEFQESNGG